MDTSISVSSTAIISTVITRNTEVVYGLAMTMVNTTTVTECMMSRSQVAQTLTHAAHVVLPPVTATQKPIYQV